MKIRYTGPLAIAACAGAIGLAPVAVADVTVQHAIVDQSPGNAQITAIPGPTAQEAARNQQPFGGASGSLLYHH